MRVSQTKTVSAFRHWKRSRKIFTERKKVLTTSHNEGIAPVQSHADIIGSLPASTVGAYEAVITSLDDAKAEEIITIDITGKSSLGDAMIVVSGRSHRHVGAIAERLLRDLKAAGYGTAAVEGLPHCDWVLVDTGDLIIHIFRPEVREFYNLEKMWLADTGSEKIIARA